MRGSGKDRIEIEAVELGIHDRMAALGLLARHTGVVPTGHRFQFLSTEGARIVYRHPEVDLNAPLPEGTVSEGEFR